MPYISHDAFTRSGLLVCDDCDHVLMMDGRRSAAPLRDTEPDDFAPHYHTRETVGTTATNAGWKSSGGPAATARWSCPDCTAAGKPAPSR